MERRVKCFRNGKQANYFAFVDIFIDKETNLPVKRWRCVSCGEVIGVTFLEDALMKHRHKGEAKNEEDKF